jgi:hypothetical protein
VKILAVILALLIGVAGVIAGGADDSPGLQLIGAVFVVGAVVGGVRSLRARRQRSPAPR